MEKAYILSKNEEANIGRCLKALNELNFEAVVLDSGSRDRTVEIAREHKATIHSYEYIDHCTAYNEITSSMTKDDWCLILDADMIVSQELAREIETKIDESNVVKAPIEMIYAGRVLRYASLCPPQPIAFRGGKKYFRPEGHGERLRPEVVPATTKAALIHDDRESLNDYVQKQIRYADAFITRSQLGESSLKDKIRRKTPLGILAAPLISLFIKGGILDGRAGIIYAIDRMISEAIKYRKSLECDINSTRYSKNERI
jgi:glycosyltransferase involved in cell wall biosynthesis